MKKGFMIINPSDMVVMNNNQEIIFYNIINSKHAYLVEILRCGNLKKNKKSNFLIYKASV